MKIPIDRENDISFCTIWTLNHPMIAGSNDYCNLADASDFASRRVDCRTTNRPAAGVPITSDTDTTLLRYCCQRLFDKHSLKFILQYCIL